MALQGINGITWPWLSLGQAPSLGTLTFDSTADRGAFIFQAPKAGDLDRMEILIGAVTTWPTGGVQVGWQGVTETAAPVVPNGAYTHSVTVTVSPGAGWWNPGTFVDGGAARRTVTQGELLSFVITPVSGTTSFTVNRLDDAVTQPNNMAGHFPAWVVNVSGSYAATADPLVLALWYNGDSSPVFLHPAALPITAIGLKSISSANPTYGGLLFQAPYSCKTFRAYLRLDTDEIESIILCTDDATTPITSVSWDKDRRLTTASGGFWVTFDTETTLSINTDYRLVVKNSASATVCGVAYISIPSAAYAAAHPLGQIGYWTQSDDGTTWAETDTDIPMIQPVFSAFDDGVGGGGGGLAMPVSGRICA